VRKPLPTARVLSFIVPVVRLILLNDIENYTRFINTHPSVQTDSRKDQTRRIFFALKGPSFKQGINLQSKRLEDGAILAVIDEKELRSAAKHFSEDALTNPSAISKISQATIHHSIFLAITGSMGKKHTTKELIHSVLSTSFKTHTTEGNLNNHLGVPLTLLKIKPDRRNAVIEMGANHIGEIAYYCQIALPTHGIITNCGKAHLEDLGVKKA